MSGEQEINRPVYMRTLLAVEHVSINPRGKARFSVPGMGKGSYLSVDMRNLSPKIRQDLKNARYVLALVNTKAENPQDLKPRKFEIAPPPVPESEVFDPIVPAAAPKGN